MFSLTAITGLLVKYPLGGANVPAYVYLHQITRQRGTPAPPGRWCRSVCRGVAAPNRWRDIRAKLSGGVRSSSVDCTNSSCLKYIRISYNQFTHLSAFYCLLYSGTAFWKHSGLASRLSNTWLSTVNRG